MPNPQQLKERIYALNPELKKLHPDFNGTKIISYGSIQLQHVLKAIGNIDTRIELDRDSDIVKIRFGLDKLEWNTTKTFDQNIAENEELVTFLLSIIK